MEPTDVDIEEKKIIEVDLIKKEIAGYLLKDGLTVKTSFDDLDIGEYYRIYSMELEIIYEKQNITFHRFPPFLPRSV